MGLAGCPARRLLLFREARWKADAICESGLYGLLCSSAIDVASAPERRTLGHLARLDLIKLAFVSSKEHLAAPFVERLRSIYPELPLWVVSEFPPQDAKWIPYKPNRTMAENYARVKAAVHGQKIRISACILEP